jgi:hypothetical protein
MNARDDSLAPAAAAGQRFAQLLSQIEAAKKGPVAELISAMPIVILVRAAREALAQRQRQQGRSSRGPIDAA